MEKKDEKDVEDKFSELIAAELRKLPETELVFYGVKK